MLYNDSFFYAGYVLASSSRYALSTVIFRIITSLVFKSIATMYATIDSNLNESRKKCLTKSEYYAIADWIDSSINNNHDFILNRYGVLTSNALNRYPHVHTNTIRSIVEDRVHQYVRQQQRKVFSSTYNDKSPSNYSATYRTTATGTSKVFMNRRQQERINKNSMSSTKTMNERYKELVANGTELSPLITLADKLLMPAMLVAKFVLADQIKVEKLKEKLDQQHSNNDGSLNSVGSTASNLQHYTDTKLKRDVGTYDSKVKEPDTSYSIDEELSKQLNWLTCKLRSMYTAESTLNQFDSSSNNSNTNCISTTNKNFDLTPHQLAMATWLIRKDPQLAYEVYKCSVVDGYYGSCVEYITSSNGKRFEQILKQNMTVLTKSLTNRPEKNYITEKDCRLRGLDTTPDILLHEPVAILLYNVDNIKYSQKYTATNYVGGSDSEIRVLNWIESKAMFGGPDQLRKATQGQLFPYWNRYGPGAVIYWFGHILEDNDKEHGVHDGVSINKSANDTSPSKVDSSESFAFNFWSKYCLLMDGFPSAHTIAMHKRHNGLKKKSSTSVSMTV